MTSRHSVLMVAVILIIASTVFGTLNTAVSKKISYDKVSKLVSNSATAIAAGNKTGSNQTGPAPGIAVSDPGAEGQKKSPTSHK